MTDLRAFLTAHALGPGPLVRGRFYRVCPTDHGLGVALPDDLCGYLTEHPAGVDRAGYCHVICPYDAVDGADESQGWYWLLCEDGYEHWTRDTEVIPLPK